MKVKWLLICSTSIYWSTLMLSLNLGHTDKALSKTNSLSPQEVLHGHKVSSSTVSKPLIFLSWTWGLDYSWTAPGPWPLQIGIFWWPKFENHMLGADHFTWWGIQAHCPAQEMTKTFPTVCPPQSPGSVCFKCQNRFARPSVEQRCDWLVMSALGEAGGAYSPSTSSYHLQLQPRIRVCL